jgi:pyruvate-ferredoxin/flavodoxin oxidoreductase
MQPCFFELTDLLPRDQAMAGIRAEIEATYGKRGPEVVRRNLEAVEHALANLHRVEVPDRVTADTARFLPASQADDDFVTRVTARILAGQGDQLPVSALPPDGTFPTGTAKWEQRSIAQELPIWDPDLCIDCGKCAIVCPHAAIRLKVFDPHNLDAPTPEFFPSKDFNSRDLDGYQLTVQVAPDDCTGCGVCVEACPARSKEQVGHKAIDMEPAADHRDLERQRWDVFTGLPELDRTAVEHGNVKNSQLLQPLFEFSGACAGCGETPYLKLMTQLFGDRAIIANATGCSSIYGGNLPTTPWTVDPNGRGPAWANSLFEDNAEFGLGIRVGLDHQVDAARLWAERLADRIGADLVEELLAADQSSEQGIADQRARVATLEATLDRLLDADDLHPTTVAELTHLKSLAGALVRKNVWIVGGDGWAYDIGFGGLDHVLGSGLDVNILVMDTEVYSNTGGQASKATSRGAVAKFATAGKATPKKDLGMLATQYGNVYIAQVAMGANDMQTVRAFREAEAWPGPSLILAYSTCIAHGVDMSQSMVRMREAVQTGYWPLYRYRPGEEEGTHPFQLDSKRPSRPVTEFMDAEARFAMLRRSDPDRAAQLAVLAQSDVDERWNYYEQLADVERQQPSSLEDEDDLAHTPHATVVAPDRPARPDRSDPPAGDAVDKEPGDA